MNKASFVCAAIGAFLAIQPAQAATIDFNSLSGTFSTYTESGATITTVGGGTYGIAGSPAGSPSILADGGPRPLFRVDFSSLVGFVSVDLGDFNADPDELYLELFSSGDVSLALTTLLISASDSTMHTLSASFAGGAAYALFGGRTPSINGNSVYADNLTFRAVNPGVPEPATWGLMIAGFALAGSVMRVRKSSAVFA